MVAFALIGAAVARVTVRRGILTGIALVVVLALYAHGVRQQLALQARIAATAPRPYDAALALTGDIADTEEVAAFGMAAWPIAAGGQKVLSVSWPEPGIPDLAQRQAVTAALFDPALSLSDRQALAARHGVQVLIVDVRSLPADTLAALAAQAVRSRAESSLRRFDLFD